MQLKNSILPKASLHVHLEATFTPEQGRKFAAKNGKVFPEHLVDAESNKWFFPEQNFLKFLDCYDKVNDLLVIEDMETVTYEYLKSCHEQGVIYVELTISPDHF